MVRARPADLEERVIAEPVSRRYRSDGLDLHYLAWGDPAAPLVLLVHGHRDHARSWDETAGALSTRWHVVAPDLRGHGDSGWSPDGAYLMPYYLYDLVTLCRQLEVQDAIAVGHSFGGNLSLRLAAMYPHLFRKLALVDGLGPPATTYARWEEAGPVSRVRDWLERRRALVTSDASRMPSVDDAVARFRKVHTHTAETRARALVESGIRRDGDGWVWKHDPLVAQLAPEDLALDASRFWDDVAAPTLLVWGTESWTSNPEQDGRADHFRDHRTVVFEGAGHWPHHDSYEEFLSVLTEFLETA